MDLAVAGVLILNTVECNQRPLKSHKANDSEPYSLNQDPAKLLLNTAWIFIKLF